MWIAARNIRGDISELVFDAEVVTNSDLINSLTFPVVGFPSLKLRVSLKIGPEGGRLHAWKALRVHWLMVP